MLAHNVLRAVIFDLDHTLIRSQIDFSEMKASMINYLRAESSSFRELDNKWATYEIIRYAVESLERQGLADAASRVTCELDRIMTNIEMRYVSKVTMIDGALQALSKLKGAGLKIGILTRSCRMYADEVLRTTGLSAFVDEVAARDDCENPKPDPSQVFWLLSQMNASSDTVLMVGDHPTDSLCARNAKIRFVGVMTGFWGEEQVNQLGPTVIPSVKELPSLLGL